MRQGTPAAGPCRFPKSCALPPAGLSVSAEDFGNVRCPYSCARSSLLTRTPVHDGEARCDLMVMNPLVNGVITHHGLSRSATSAQEYGNPCRRLRKLTPEIESPRHGPTVPEVSAVR